MFVKLFNQILDSSIADNRPLRHFFTDLLLCSDPQGFVMMTEAAIARRIGATLEEVKWGLAELEKPDHRSKTPDNDGKRIERLDGSGYGWRILNFETYKMMKSAEDMREKTRDRVRRFRDKNKDSGDCNADVTPCNDGNACNTTKRKKNTNTNTNTKIEENTPNPQGGFDLKSDSLQKPDPNKAAIGKLLGRRDSTKWSNEENRLLKAIGPIHSDDLELMQSFYFAEIPKDEDYRRTTIERLLKHWTGELDKARAYKHTKR